MVHVVANAWLADLYEAHFGAVFRQCLAHLGDREEAADAAHDVFAKTAAFGTPLEPGDRSQAWLLTVARNHCIDLLRRRHRLTGALLRLQSDPDRTADPERTTIDRHLVHAVMDPLPARDRQLLWETAVERRPLREIAADLRLSYLAAAQALRRARQRAGAIAGRVAAVFGIWGGRRGASVLPAARAALLAGAVPLLIMSSQSSLDQSAPRSVRPSAITASSGGAISVRALVRSAEVARLRETARPRPVASGSVPSQPTARVLSVGPLPSIGPTAALKAVLEESSRLPTPLPGTSLRVALSRDEAVLTSHGLTLSR